MRVLHGVCSPAVRSPTNVSRGNEKRVMREGGQGAHDPQDYPFVGRFVGHVCNVTRPGGERKAALAACARASVFG